jgi:hypothetical protein
MFYKLWRYVPDPRDPPDPEYDYDGDTEAQYEDQRMYFSDENEFEHSRVISKPKQSDIDFIIANYTPDQVRGK